MASIGQGIDRVDGRLVIRSLRPIHSISKVLLDHTALAHRTLGQNLPGLGGAGEIRVRQTHDAGRRVHGNLDRHALAPRTLVFPFVDPREHERNLLLAEAPDGVELLEPEADRIHEPVACRATRV